ncbi:MAG: hypothetical protein H0U69_03415 [Trueperaceae bacterium]|nr:hypothetical protein [Trueperaceae bacterium]
MPATKPERLFERSKPFTASVALVDVDIDVPSRARSLVGRSIETFGQLTLPLLQSVAFESDLGLGCVRYRVIDGARRIAVMRAQGYERIMAAILPADVDEAEIAAMATSLNLLRAPNPLREAEHFQTLRRAGFTLDEISRDLGISRSTIAKRLKLVEGLREDLLDRVWAGEVAIGTAERIANLTPAQQERLVLHTRGEARITSAHISDVLRVSREGVMARVDEVMGEARLFAPADMLEDAAGSARAEGLTFDDALAALQRAFEVA